jgi:hypothetical protein
MKKARGFFSDSQLKEINRAFVRHDPYQRYFDEYNRKYFNGSLPDYRIWTAWRTHWQPMYQKEDVDILGRIYYRQRIIRLQLTGNPLGMLDVLIHEMAHAAHPGDGHGPKWRAEMLRLYILGAFRCTEPEDFFERYIKEEIELRLNRTL